MMATISDQLLTLNLKQWKFKMEKPTKISENSQIQLDLKTLIIIIAFTASLAGTYFSLSAQIEDAKNLPAPEVSKIELDFKDKLTRSVIEKVEADVTIIKSDLGEIKENINKMDERLYEISQKVR